MSVFSKDRLRAIACRASFLEFVKRFWKCVPGAGGRDDSLVMNWHIELMCEELQAIAERVFEGKPKEYDWALNISPGTSKSTIISILFPAWIWTRMPHARVMTASHTESLVLDLANKSRDVIRHEQYRLYFPEIELAPAQDAKGYYRNTAGGDRYTCTVAGKSPMGFHGHFLIIDDPIDPKKVLSEVELKTAHDFMTDVISTRKVNKEVSVTLLVMQRLGIGDPTEVVLEQAKVEGAAKVRHICLPGELLQTKAVGEDGASTDAADYGVQPPELAARYVDGLMDPKRLSRRVLAEFKAKGDHFFATQILQRPYAKSGGLFKFDWFYLNKPVKTAPFHAQRVRYWDRACLTGDTWVTMSDGQKQIKDVRAGEYVWTRAGLKRVIWAGPTKSVQILFGVLFANGSMVRGTADHRVFTENRGWVPLALLTNKDVCLSWPSTDPPGTKTPKQLNLMESSTVDGQEPDILKRCAGTNNTNVIGTIHCTAPNGDTYSVRSRLGVTSIIKTKILTTTDLKILNAFRAQNTIDGTMRSNDGIKQKLPPCSAVETSNDFGKTESRLSTSVFDAVAAMNLAACALADAPPANNENGNHQPNNAKIATQISKGVKSDVINAITPAHTVAALCANRDSNAAALDQLSIAANHAQPNSKEQPELITVFDLEVEDAHEFFANGILVHNSSTTSAACETAGTMIAKSAEGRYFVEHCAHGRWEPGERNRRMLAQAHADRNRFGEVHEPVIWIEREGGASGRDAWLEIVRVLAGFKVREHNVGREGSKYIRAEPWATQWEGGNCVLVNDGTWNINYFVNQHVAFTGVSGLMDVVDSASGAFNRLANDSRLPGTIHVRRLRSQADRDQGPKLRVLICTPDQLQTMVIDEPHVVILIMDPPCASEDTPGLIVSPTSSLAENAQCLRSVALSFADICNEELHDRWNDPYEPYGKPPSQLVITKEIGKQLWRALLQKTAGPTPQTIVLCGNGDRRPLSTAYAICDVLRVPRSIIEDLSSDLVLEMPKEAPNKNVYAVVKAARDMVL